MRRPRHLRHSCMRVRVCVLMRTYATKNISNVLLERAITGIGARSPCAIYPLNKIKRDMGSYFNYVRKKTENFTLSPSEYAIEQ